MHVYIYIYVCIDFWGVVEWRSLGKSTLHTNRAVHGQASSLEPCMDACRQLHLRILLCILQLRPHRHARLQSHQEAGPPLSAAARLGPAWAWQHTWKHYLTHGLTHGFGDSWALATYGRRLSLAPWLLDKAWVVRAGELPTKRRV